MREGMKQSSIGLIPKEWNTEQFREIFEIVKSHSFSRNKLTSIETNQKIQNIHYGDIHSKFTNHHLDFETENVPYIIDAFLTEEHNQFLKDGDIVIADVSEDLIDIGKCIELKNVKNRKVIGGLHTIVARDKKNKIEKGFGAYIFKHPEVIKELRSIATGMSVYGISKGNLNKLFILLPPLPEQRKIAYILSTVQKAIEMQDKLIRHTTELKKALMQKLFTEGTKGEKQKQTEIGLVPESWEEIIIGDLGKCVTGTTPKTAVEEYWNSNDFDFIAPADIGNTKYVYNSAKMMSNEGLKVSRILPKNSVLCVCIGSSIGKVGLTFKDQSATNQQINSIICKAEYNPIYTYYLLVQYAEHWRGHATFGPVPILNKGQFELIKIFVTKDKQEQSLIAESLQTFDSKIEFHGKKKQSLYNLFKTLLHELMTGERRVHEIEFEALTKAYKIKEQPLSMAAEK